MTEEQYKEGLLVLLEVFQEIEEAQTWEEVDTLTSYGITALEGALGAIDQKRVLN